MLKTQVYSIFILTSTSLSLCSREAASSSFFSSKACPSSAAKIRSVSIPPPLSLLLGEDADEGRANESETEEDEERGKKESSRLGEGRLFFLGVNIVDGLVGVSWKASSQVLVLVIHTHTGGTAVDFCQIQKPFSVTLWSGLAWFVIQDASLPNFYSTQVFSSSQITLWARKDLQYHRKPLKTDLLTITVNISTCTMT